MIYCTNTQASIWIMIYFLFFCMALSDKHHECVHNKLKFNTEEINVDYGINNNNNNNNDRRRLTDSNTDYIRILPYWETMTSSTEHQSITKKLVTAAINFIANATKVIPVSGNLLVTETCGLINTPTLHHTNGIANADLVVYVTTKDDYCSSNTLAWAHHCTVDQNKRPTSGVINICPSKDLASINWKLDVETLLHELLHIMIMSPDIWNNFATTTTHNTPYSSNLYITTNKVKSIARNHFNCNTLVGAPIEDDGGQGSAGAHWEEHHLHTEIMQAVVHGNLQYISEFTFGLMEDSGWYYMNYNYTEPLIWGKNEGCTFFEKSCLNTNTMPATSNFPQYFCEHNNDDGCLHDYTGHGNCRVVSWNSIPNDFQYFTDANKGGLSQFNEFCPIHQVWGSNWIDFEWICFDDSRGITLGTLDLFNLDSRCAKVKYNGDNKGVCFKHTCKGYNSNTGLYDSVDITITGTNVVINCERNDKNNWKSTNIETLTQIVCPNIDAICQSSKPFECKWGFYKDELNKCICSPGYIGDKCDTQSGDIKIAADGVNTMSTTMLFIAVILFSLCVL